MEDFDKVKEIIEEIRDNTRRIIELREQAQKQVKDEEDKSECIYDISFYPILNTNLFRIVYIFIL